jgi:PiT family inorganic phosphate transporter
MTGVMLLLIVTIIIVMIFNVTNGFHDASNMVGTLVASRALSPAQAILLVGVFTFIGPVVGGTAVADTVGGFIIIQNLPPMHTLLIVLCGVLAAVIWNLVTWRLSLPSSSSHALVGGLVGVIMLSAGSNHVVWGFDQLRNGQLAGVTKIILSLFFSPVLGFIAGFLLHKFMRWMTRRAQPSIDHSLRRAQWLTAGVLAYSHGTNDAQKGMGIITLLLVISGFLQQFHVPMWVILVSAISMTMGTMLGGWRIIRTVGYGIYRLRPLHGLDAQLASAAVILSASAFGGPVSTTHVVSTSIMGIGASERPGAVRWGMAAEIILSWLVTLPCAGLLACIIYMLIKYCTGFMNS